MNLDLRKFFTPEAIVDSLSRLPELKTPIMDRFFSDVRNIARPVVGVRDLGLPAGTIPVVRRGSSSFPIYGNGGKVTLIEPQPVNPSEFLSGADLNNLRALNESTIQQEMDTIIDRIRRVCRTVSEALGSQALTGKIAYPMKVDGGASVDYEVDYGPIINGSPAVTKKFDAADAKISDVIKSLANVITELKKTCDGNDVEILAGADVYGALCDLIGASSNPTVGRVLSDGVEIGGGLKVSLFNATYRNPRSKAAVPVVPAKNVLIVDKQAGHKLIYAGLDSLDSDQQALPFFATFEEKKDPPGVKIIGESKPLPVVNVNGIIKAQVLT